VEWLGLPLDFFVKYKLLVEKHEVYYYLIRVNQGFRADFEFGGYRVQIGMVQIEFSSVSIDFDNKKIKLGPSISKDSKISFRTSTISESILSISAFIWFIRERISLTPAWTLLILYVINWIVFTQAFKSACNCVLALLIFSSIIVSILSIPPTPFLSDRKRVECINPRDSAMIFSYPSSTQRCFQRWF